VPKGGKPWSLCQVAIKSEQEEEHMSDSVYKVIELVGTSESSWEDAAKTAVELAGKSLKDLRVAEVKELDVKVENGTVVAYRAKLSLSFKYESS
jgi:flavin-binding protein dodecin